MKLRKILASLLATSLVSASIATVASAAEPSSVNPDLEATVKVTAVDEYGPHITISVASDKFEEYVADGRSTKSVLGVAGIEVYLTLGDLMNTASVNADYVVAKPNDIAPSLVNGSANNTLYASWLTTTASKFITIPDAETKVLTIAVDDADGVINTIEEYNAQLTVDKVYFTVEEYKNKVNVHTTSVGSAIMNPNYEMKKLTVGNASADEPVATSIVINEGDKVTADATGKATLTATVLDQNGEAMDPQPAVVWSDDSEDATVTNGAFAATVKKDAYDVNVTATVDGTEISSSATVVVVPAAAKVATTVVINDGAESVDTNAEGNVTLTAAVKDQFGDAMDTAVVWTSDNGDVTVDNGVVTAAIKADAYTATITATAGAASDTIVVNVPAEVKVPSVTAIGAKKTAGQNAMYWGVKWSNIANPAWKVTLTKNDADQRQFSVNLAGATFDGTGDKAFGFYLKVSNTADKFTFKVEDTTGTVSATANADGVAVNDLI